MKKINLLIILCLLAVMLPLNVAANTFTNEGKQYKITKADAACTQFEYITSGEDATVIYADENTGEIWSLSSDNTCRLMTRTEIINNQDKYTYISYNVDFNTDGTALFTALKYIYLLGSH